MRSSSISITFNDKARRWLAVAGLVALGASTSTDAPLQAYVPPPAEAPPTVGPRVIADYGKLPLHFEANQGQTADPVKFLARGSGYGLFLTPTESVLVLRKTKAGRPQGHGGRAQHVATASSTEPPAVLRMTLLGANPRPVVAGREELPGKSNYFIGNDPAKWRTNVAQFARVEYEDVYPGVSLAYYGHQGQIEYDFTVKPGADPNRIRFGIEGADAVRVAKDGSLLLSLPGGEIAERAPVVYQEAGGARQAVDGRFVLRGAREVGFEVGAYERDKPLVLDPLLVYSTYLGGSGNDEAMAIAVDAFGQACITGWTVSTDFPTVAPFQSASRGGFDVFVTKLNAAGSALVYSTYVGGNGDDLGQGIAVDASGNAYVTGIAASADFPTMNPLQDTYGGAGDGFVLKLNAAGSALVYATYLGGSGSDEGRGVAVDASGNAYIAGATQSSNFRTANPIQPALAGGRDAFVAKINVQGSALAYSTYLGGTGSDAGSAIAVDEDGDAYVTGDTLSTDFPTVNAIQVTYGGGFDDVFVTKINASGSALLYSTYLGGASEDGGFGIAVDRSQNAYVTGFAESADFPTASPLDATLRGLSDAFVAKLNGDGSVLVYSTYIGGSAFDVGYSIAVDGAGSAYVAGYTGSTDFPTVNAVQPAYGGGFGDAFVAKLNPAGSAFMYATYIGGTDDENGRGIAVSGSGNAYVSGRTYSSDFPTVKPIRTLGGGSDAFVANIGSPPVAGDFNADLKADILWRNTSTGANLVWFMNGTTLDSGAFLTSVADQNWQIAATADLNDDGQTDILWRNQATGQNVVWLMTGTTLTSAVFLTPVPDLNWQIAATADFNADGNPDIVWRNRATGENVVWFMNGTTLTSGAVLTSVADTTWTIAGAADFNSDGKPDILWRNQASGGNLVWFMDGTTVSSGAVLPAVSDVHWVIGGVADYNADSKPDILWRNQTTGDNLVWLMDGVTIASGVVLTPVPDTTWRMVGPR